MKGGLFLNVVIGEGATIFQLLAGENQSLLIRWDSLLILNLRLDIVNRVGRFHLEGDRLSRQRLDEDLHTTTEAEHQVESRLLLDVIVGEGATVLELFTSEDQALLVRWDSGRVLVVLCCQDV